MRDLTVRLRAVVTQYNGQMQLAGMETRRFGQRLLEVSRSSYFAFTSIGFAVTGAGAAMVLALHNMRDAASEFEGSLTRMITLAGMSRTEMESFAQELMGMTEIGRTPQELADALYFIASSGQQGADAMNILDSSARAASIGLGETKTIATLLTTVLNAYGTENISAAEATDILTASVIEGTLEASDLAPVLGRLVGMGAALGVEFSDVSGSMALLSRVGVSAAQGATMVSAIFTSLLTTSPKVSAALESVGLTTEDLRRTLAEEGIVGVLRQLDTAFGSNVESLRTIFPNVRAFRGAMNLLAQDAQGVDEVLNNVTNSTGVTGDAFEEWSKTSEAASARFSAAMSAAGIALGNILLPPINAVLDVGANLFDFLASLPGPVRTLAVAMMAGSAAFLLFAGGLFLLLPRIAQVRDALISLNVSSKLFEGSAQLMGRALRGPFALGLVAAVGAITMYSRAKQEATRRTAEFVAALEADNGAISENTRRAVAAALEEQGLLEVIQDQQVSLELVTDAVLGNRDAWAQLQSELGTATFINASGGLELITAALERMMGNFVEARNVGMRTGAAVGEAANGAVEPFGDLSSAILDTQETMEDTATAAEELADALDILSGKPIAVEEATIRWRSSLRDLTSSIKENGDALRGNSEAADLNKQSVLNAVEAAERRAVAIADETGSVEAGTKAFIDMVNQIVDTAVQAGVAESVIRGYLRTLGLTPKEIRTLISAHVAQAQDDIDRFIRNNDGRIIAIRVKTMGGDTLPTWKTEHAGGTIGASGASRYHGGGQLRGDEQLFIGQRGERVVTANQWRNLTSARPGVMMARGGPSRFSFREPVMLNIGGQKFEAFLEGVAESVASEVAETHISAARRFEDEIGRMGG